MVDFRAPQQLKILALAFWSPSAAIDKIVLVGKPWLIQAVVLSLQLGVMAVAFKFAVDFRSGLLPGTMDAEMYAASLRHLRAAGCLVLLGTTIKVFLSWYLIAGALHILNIILTAREQPFGRLFSLAVLASVYSVFADLHTTVVWFVRGADSFASPQEFSIPIGVNLAPMQWSPFWYAFMGHLNFYEFASAMTMAFGFVRLTGSSRTASYPCIFVGWLACAAARSFLH